MTTLIDYALMAGASYISNRSDQNKFPIPSGWLTASNSHFNDSSTGFEAISFVNKATIATSTEIVISYAGTDPNDRWGDIIGTDLVLAAGKLCDQLRQAADYYLQVKASAPAGATISFTGHSLGGGLASLMAVMFGESAFTFDQAPFLNSAKTFTSTDYLTGNTIPRSVALDLRAYLTGRATNDMLAKLDAFIAASDPFNPNPIAADTLAARSVKVSNINTQGEFLSSWYLVPSSSRIGSQATIANSNDGVSGLDLHSQALLTAMLQSGDTPTSTASDHTLGQVTFKLTDLLKIIFDKKLYAFDTDIKNTTNENFLERLVRHQAGSVDGVPIGGDAMVTRFTDDMWKIALDTGMFVPGSILNKALIAAAIEDYYFMPNGSSAEFFNNITGGISFNLADIGADWASKKAAPMLDNAVTQQLNLDLQTRVFLRQDNYWSIQSGTGALITIGTGTNNDAMLGGASSDILDGGAGNDFLYGGDGADTLTGGAGSDLFEGGTGSDIYYTGAGDRILDSDGQGTVYFGADLLNGGTSQDGVHTWQSADGAHRYAAVSGDIASVDGATLIVDGALTIEHFHNNDLGISLTAGQNPDTPQPPQTTNDIIGDPLIHTATLAPGGEGANWMVIKTYNYLNDDQGHLISYSADYYLVDANRNPTEGGQQARDDTLLHDTAGNDHFMSGDGKDTITLNMGGDDIVDTGAGDDTVTITKGGNDVINLGAGDDNLITYYSATGNLTVNGGDGRDYLGAGSGRDLIEGGAGADFLYGSSENDRLYGDTKIDTATAIGQGETQEGSGQQGELADAEDGNDLVVTGAGNDLIAGGAGDDLIITGAGNDYIDGDLNIYHEGDQWKNWAVTETTTDNGYSYSFQNIYTESNDGVGDDTIYAGAGDDVADGQRGNDTLYMGAGNDKAWGDEGNDILIGGAGDDMLNGDNGISLAGSLHGNDYLDGGDGNDILIGDGGNDMLFGGAGNDQLFGDSDQIPLANHGNDYLDGEAGDDYLRGYGGDDELFGGDGADQMLGEDGNDYLDGEAGSDLIDGGNGNDTIFGGTGDDSLLGDAVVGTATAPGDDYIDGEDGNDTIDGREGNDTIFGGAGDDTLYGGAGANYIDGGDGNDILNSGGPGSSLFGGAGIDDISAVGGGNYLDGEDDNDTLTAEGGNNTLIGGAGDDNLAAFGGNNYLDDGEGSNTLYADGGNNTLIAGAGDDTLSGEGGNNYLDGGDGNDSLQVTGYGNTLIGGAGNDILQDGEYGVLIGGTGDDILNGGGGDDVYVYNLGDGEDHIVDSSVNGQINTLRFGGGISTSNITIGFDHIAGSLSLDLGNGDVLHIDNFNPDDAAKSSSIQRFEFADRTLTAKELMATIGFVLNGTSGDDFITGTSSSDTIDGGSGNDTLEGGLGNDTLIGGGGQDTYLMGFGTGADTIIDSTASGGTIKLGASLDLANLSVVKKGNDLLLQVSGTNDGMLIKNYYSNPQAVWTIKDSADNATTPQAIIDNLAQQSLVTRAEYAFIAQAKASVISSYLAQGYRMQGDGTLYLQQFIGNPLSAYNTITDSTSTRTQWYYNGQSSYVVTLPPTSTTTQYWQSYSAPSLWNSSVSVSVTDVSSNDQVVYADPDLSLAQWVSTKWLEVSWENTSTKTGKYAWFGFQSRESHYYQEKYIYELGISFDPEAYSLGALIGYETLYTVCNYTLNSFAGTITNILSSPGSLNTSGELPQAVATQYINKQYTSNIQKIALGDAGQTVYANGLKLVNGGDGNDTIYDAGFAYGGAGDDTLIDCSIMAGGAGNDTMEDTMEYSYYQGKGTRFLIDPQQTGNDLIRDFGSELMEYDSYDQYVDWYYQSVGIQNKSESRHWGGYYTSKTISSDTGYFTADQLSDPNNWLGGWFAVHPGDLRYVEPLPLVPYERPAANDYAVLQALYDAGVIAMDTVEFDAGISLPDLALSWGTDLDRLTLNLSWNNGTSQVRLVMPNEDDPLGFGVEQVKFWEDGSVVGMKELIALAPPPPDLHLTGTDEGEYLKGDIGNDTIIGLGGDDWLYGRSGNDILDGGAGDDGLIGGDGNDTLIGEGGNDTLIGGGGNDRLIGGAGSDTYIVFRTDSEQDTIEEDAASPDFGTGDSISFDNGIVVEDIRAVRGGIDNNDLIVSISGTDASLVIEGWFSSVTPPISQFTFSDRSLRTAEMLDMAMDYAPTLTAPSSLTVTEDVAGNLVYTDIPFADVDDGTLTVTLSITDGAITGNAGTGITIGGTATARTFSGTTADLNSYFTTAGNITYQTVLNNNTARTLTTSVSDGRRSSSATSMVNIIAVNDAPDTAAASGSGNEDAASIAVALSGSDIDGTVASFKVTSLPANGTLYSDAGLTTAIAANGIVTASGNAATVYFKPAANWNGSTSFNYASVDNNGLQDVTPAIATITVAAVNDNPISNNDTLTTAEDTVLTIAPATLLANDTDVDGNPLSITSVQGAVNGAVALVGGNVVFTPNANYNGTGAFFTYTVSDGQGGSATTTANVTVTSVNDAPDTAAASGSGNENAASIPVALSGSDIDGTVASFKVTSLPANGTLYSDAGLTTVIAANGSVTASGNAATVYFKPAANWNGSTSFNYASVDNNGLQDATPAIATITVAPANSIINGTTGNDNLTGTLYIDSIYGLAGNDTLNGLDGNDLLDGGAGADTMIGGLGNDTYIVDNTADKVTETSTLATEIDTVQSSVTYTLTSNVENLTLTGTGTIIGTGNASANMLIGNSVANTLSGGAGNDTLDGGLGADSMSGGADNDTYIVDNTADKVTETSTLTTEIDTVQSSVTYTLTTNVENLTLTGTANISGTGNARNNILIGNDGNNTLNGGVGADTMTGGLGNDTYIVDHTGDIVTETSTLATENDTVQSSVTYTLRDNIENLTLTGTGTISGTGNTANNVLTGNSVANTLSGGIGNDTLNGGLGADSMSGGDGNDTYIVDNTADKVTETSTLATEIDTVQSSVTYTLSTNVENLTLTGTGTIIGTGNALANMLIGNSVANTLSGGAGNDTLDGGLGADSMSGGADNDTYVVDNTGDIVTETSTLTTEIDTVQSSVTYTLTTNVENLTLTGTANISGTGNTSDNVLIGNSVANTLSGGAGNDTLDGGLGADSLSGGTGNDTYVVDNTGDIVTETSTLATEIDTVQSSIAYTLGTNVENLTLTGTAAISGTGNALNNILTGNDANNTLSGGTGADTMKGGFGNDTYVVDDTGDIVTETSTLANEIDTVQSSVTYILGDNIENLTLTGAGTISGTGNTADNVLTGNSVANTLSGGIGNDTLDGGLGADSLSGGAGNDTYVVDNPGDIVAETSTLANEIDTVQSSIACTLGANVENLTLTGMNTINGTGNSLNNVLIGNSVANGLTGGAGNDTLLGGAGSDSLDASDGSDILDGGAGNDYLYGGTGNDIYLFGYGSGQDTIYEIDSTAMNVDAVQLAADVLTSEVTLVRDNNDLVVTINNTTDRMTVQRWFSDPANRVEEIRDANGTVLWDTAHISAIPSNPNGTEGNDTLYGHDGNADIMYGNGGIDGMYGYGGNDFLNGGTGGDNLLGGEGNDILQGGAGSDTLSDTAGANLLDGGTDADTLVGGQANEIFVGGAGNDTIYTGNGYDIIAFNRGDGQDILSGGGGTDNTLSLGGGIQYSDLALSKVGYDLILEVGNSEQITLKNWYNSPGNNKTVLDLQVVADAMSAFDTASTDPMLNKAIQQFNFTAIADSFDVARGANATFMHWSALNALLPAYLSGSDSAAFGGDLAHQYGKNGTLTGMNLGAAQSAVNDPLFGAQAQTLHDLTGLQGGAVSLG